MKNLIDGFAEQLRLAVQIGMDAKVNNNNVEIRNIVIAGMGGSGIGGDIVSFLVKASLNVPIEVVRGYNIPNYVNQNTLFIASSYSGDTEETCECMDKAIEKRATICVVTSGGNLLEKSKNVGTERIIIPGGTSCPRANVGLSFVALLFVIYKFDLISNEFIEQIKKGATLIDEDKDELVFRAKQLSKSLKSKLPIIYSDDVFYPVALRFQQQLNENSKQLTHINVFPEMNHNELVGWSAPNEAFIDMGLVFIKNKFSHPSVVKRMEICKDIFEEKCDSIIEVFGKGDSILEQYIYLFHLADWASYFIAIENDVDPFPVEKIDYLKSKLA